MEENMSDSEEEDLEALRLAALATLKSRTPNKPDPESPETSPRNSPNAVIQTALFPRKEPSSSSANPYAWRNNAAPARRGRGRGGFPKVNQRSNLIVITPVGAENEFAANRETPAPQLLLPQHKWCQAANENSSSPKTFSKRGPTRFNRHDSDSESSDSDYDDISDQDSYSNETILQDENSMTFQDERIDRESTPVTDEVDDNHRLNFPVATNNTASDLNEPTKYSSYQYKSQQAPFPGMATYQNEIPVNGGSAQDYDGRRLSQSNPEGYSSTNFVDANLSQSDLRLELKRRMLKLRRESAEAGKPESSSDKPVRDRTRTSEDSVRGYSRDRNRTHEIAGLETATHSRARYRSRSLSRGRSRTRSQSLTQGRNRSRSKSLSHSRNRSRSRSLNRGHERSRSRSFNRCHNRSRSLSSSRNRSRSGSPRHPDRQRSSSRERNSKRYDRYSKRDRSDSPNQKCNIGSTKSPNKNGNHSLSRSPVKTHQRISISPTINNKTVLSPEKKKLSHSPVKSNKHDYIWSPEINKKDNCIQSPPKVHEKSRSRSPDRGRSRKYSPTPGQPNKHYTRDNPERTRKRPHSRSPERKTKHNRSPDSKNCKPVRGHKRISPPRSSNTRKSSRSPPKNRKRSSTRSPNRTSKVRRRSRSPARSCKSNLSSNRSRRQSPPSGLEQKHKPNAKHSPRRNEEPRNKPNLSRTPEPVLKSNSSPQRHLEQKLPHRISHSPQKVHRSPGRDHWRDSSSSSERSDRDWKGKKNTSRRWSRSSSANSADSLRSRSSRLKSISSVVKPVLSSVSAVSVVGSKDDRLFNSDYRKIEKDTIEEKPKALMSLVKSSVIVGDNRNNAPEMGKRLPVHMRLGKLPRNKLIRMAKDVEAAFVNSSSDENGESGAEGKKQNFRVVADTTSDVSKRRVEKSPVKNESKSRRRKNHR